MHLIKTALFLFLLQTSLNAQVGLGTSTPASSAQLDVFSSTKGFLPPRLTHVQRNNIASPVAGLQIWCNDCGSSGQMQVFNGTCWTDMVGGLPIGLAIGDCYEGGKVAYFLQSGDPGYISGEIHGLIAAAADQSPGAEWGCGGIYIGTASNLGSGQANTTAIVIGCATSGIAARICDDLVLNGFSDWYLPSQDELNKLCLVATEIGGFTNGAGYWSSTEYIGNTTHAYLQVFPACGQVALGKYSGYKVRAVRSF